jgi:predicted ArsR family transcriptional regulator
LLETLRTRSAPWTLTEVSAESGLHANTVREHLDALLRDGLVRRSSAPPAGRGRPASLYQATDVDPGAAREYAGLATTLAAAIHHSSSTPTDDAVAAGKEWGRRLARARSDRPSGGAQAARREVVALLDEVGFAPRADARSTVVRLTRCPLLEAANEYPDVVCGVHLGLAQGALEEYGADPGGADLLPFVEPGACRLHLTRRAR